MHRLAKYTLSLSVIIFCLNVSTHVFGEDSDINETLELIQKDLKTL